MSYYIKDVRTGDIVITCTCRDLVIHWLRSHVWPLSLDEAINITGADKYLRHDLPAESVRSIPMTLNGNEVDVIRYRPEAYALRPYQVLDEDGRSVDPRTWPEPEKPKLYCTGFCGNGRRPHDHRVGGPAMHRQTLRAIANELTDSELSEWGLCASAKTHISIRRKMVMEKGDAWDFAEEKWIGKYRSSKCWKDQHKTRRQWGKHKSGLSAPVLQPRESMEAFLQRLKDEGAPVVALA